MIILIVQFNRTTWPPSIVFEFLHQWEVTQIPREESLSEPPSIYALENIPPQNISFKNPFREKKIKDFKIGRIHVARMADNLPNISGTAISRSIAIARGAFSPFPILLKYEMRPLATTLHKKTKKLIAFKFDTLEFGKHVE